MSYKVIYGDILEYEVDAIVVPQVPHEGMLSELTTRIYEAAGFQNMMLAYQSAKHKAEREIAEEYSFVDVETICDMDCPPIVVVTSGFNLKAKNAIHICVRTTNWWDAQADSERKEKEYILYRCYYAVLECAHKEICAKSVALSLLGTDLLGYPQEVSRSIAEKAVTDWLKENIPLLPPDCGKGDEAFLKRWKGIDDPIKIYIVIPFEIPRKNTASVSDAYGNTDSFVKFEKILAQKIEGSKYDKDGFFRDTVYNYLNEISPLKTIAQLIDFSESRISRFKNSQKGSRSVPHKHRVIALAVAMKLNDYDRFEFIRCSGYEYPADERDFQVEKIMRSGITDFNEVNSTLCAINPTYDLTASVKTSSKPKQKTHEKSK